MGIFTTYIETKIKIISVNKDIVEIVVTKQECDGGFALGKEITRTTLLKIGEEKTI
uniref:Uncharacterized protein n=1 Tax=viral metagenome TaxID=1070528 RepID=A0A6M3J115_9ZZZZ